VHFDLGPSGVNFAFGRSGWSSIKLIRSIGRLITFRHTNDTTTPQNVHLAINRFIAKMGLDSIHYLWENKALLLQSSLATLLYSLARSAS
jgi:hypothetical protein